MTQSVQKIVVLGVGNILLKDEGVGVKVAEELIRRYVFPNNVSVVDGGTQGLWLLPTLQECDVLIAIDAVTAGAEPGTLHRLTGDELPKGLRAKQSAHDSDLVECLNLCELVDAGPSRVVVVGIEPADIQPFGLELTPVVAAKFENLIAAVIEELRQMGVEPEKKI